MATCRQSRASAAIAASGVMDTLRDFEPAVVSTIFADLDIDGSDIDIVCSHRDFRRVELRFAAAHRGADGYRFEHRSNHALGQFYADNFLIEVYVSATPVKQQAAFRHFAVMRRLSALGGAPFCEAVRALKLAGLKTEPAICRVLVLEGDPYRAVLELEVLSDEALLMLLTRSGCSTSTSGSRALFDA